MTASKYAEFHAELASDVTQGHWNMLEDAFCKHIRFETAGMRGRCGPGPNRINTHTIAESVQGVCDYFQASHPGKRLRAVVGFDTRIDSAWFAQATAEVLAGNGVEVRLFREPRPTPELSFAILHFKADMGFMVSASHNPPTDNGLKAYGRNAGQLLPGPSKAVISAARRVRNAKRLSLDAGRLAGLARSIGPEMDDLYHQAVVAQARSSITSCTPRQAKIVFSSLHGTGEKSIIPVLRAAGWELARNLFQVQSQRWPDPRFRGVPNQKPNPELNACLRAGIAMAEQLEADLVIASDPDADRLAIQVMDRRRGKGSVFLKGGQLAAVLTHWALSQSAAHGSLPEGGVIAHNMVTSPLIDDIAAPFGVQVRGDLPIGFKYIAQVRDELDDPKRFIMGSEQSFGTLIGSYCGEKDAASAALLICELCDHLRRARPEPRTICDLLEDLWLQYGYYAEQSATVPVPGEAGMRKIAQAMARLRRRFPAELAGRSVLQVEDVLRGIVYAPRTGRKLRDLGKAWEEENILVARLGDDGREWAIFRPSGTEPSLKVYTSLRVEVADRANLARTARATDRQARRVETDLRRHMGL
jgi:phosphomannomutase